MDLEINYNEQMLNRYPEVIKGIREFGALIATQSNQIEDIHDELITLLANAHITTADEATIEKWEQLLNITPLEQGDDDLDTWLLDRRETILARIFNPTKLNTQSIADIVSIFTGGTAVSYFKDSTIHVLIAPPKNNKQYKFANVEQELSKKIPAHLTLSVQRNYRTWQEVLDNYATWQTIKDDFTTWEDVLLYNSFS